MGKDHGLLLYLNGKLQSGLIKVQSEKDLSKSPAGLYVFAAGLYHLGKLSKADYEQAQSFYAAKKLTEEKESVPLTPSELAVKQKLAEKARQLKMVLGQWELDHKMGWREVWLQEAEKYPQLPEAQAIIQKYMSKPISGVN